jgi:ATP-dependent Lon protease
VLQLAGYTEQEKMEIAKRFLAPKAIEGSGLDAKNITLTDEAIQTVIQRYTREAGVRNLERELNSICRKVARKVVVEGKSFQESITPEKVTEYLGVPRFRPPLPRRRKKSVSRPVSPGPRWAERFWSPRRR